MTIEIQLSEEEGFEFVKTRGLAIDTTILHNGMRYKVSFISLWRLNAEIEGFHSKNMPFSLNGFEKNAVVPEITAETITGAIEYFEKERSLYYYLDTSKA